MYVRGCQVLVIEKEGTKEMKKLTQKENQH